MHNQTKRKNFQRIRVAIEWTSVDDGNPTPRRLVECSEEFEGVGVTAALSIVVAQAVAAALHYSGWGSHFVSYFVGEMHDRLGGDGLDRGLVRAADRVLHPDTEES